VRLLDLDGDGAVDAVRSGDDWQLYYNDTSAGWTGLRQGRGAAAGVRFGDPHIKVADMTGDGLPDLVELRNGLVRYWPHLGRGRWGDPVPMRQSPRLSSSIMDGSAFDPARMLLGDVDGDGCADLVYVGDGHVTVWLNRSGVGFGPPVTVRGTPGFAADGAVRIADLLGNGTAGVVWSQDAGTARHAGYSFLDLTGGVKPYLLTSVDNNRGARTTVTYASSTTFSLADRAAGRPWRTPLPFPVHVVSRITAEDVYSGSVLSTQFAYHHGYWDGDDREFRGFGRVDRLDTLSAMDGSRHWSPPTETRTWFDVGPVRADADDWRPLDLSDEYQLDGTPGRSVAYDLPQALPRRAVREAYRSVRGRALRTELYVRDGDRLADRPHTTTEHRYQVVAVTDGRGDDEFAAAAVFAVRTTGGGETRWERGVEPMRRLSRIGDHDAYGRPGVRVDAALPRGADPAGRSVAGEPFLIAVTRTTWATRDDVEHYLAAPAARRLRYEVLDDHTTPLEDLLTAALDGSAPVRLVGGEVTRFDGDAFTGLPFGQLGEHGAASRVDRLVHTQRSLADALGGDDPPPYLDPAAPAWPGEYPAEFAQALPAGGGYTYRPGDVAYPQGWWVASARRRYGSRGQVEVERDAVGGDITREYDEHSLLVTRVTDQARLVSAAEYDYRVLLPRLVTDVNGNRTAATYTPLGLLRTVAHLGRPGEEAGDTLEQPLVAYGYQLTPTREPVSVRVTRRTEHRWDVMRDERDRRAHEGRPPPSDAEVFPDNETERYPERFSVHVQYSDGFGRLLQSRGQADPVEVTDLGLPLVAGAAVGPVRLDAGPRTAVRVVVTGCVAYDNKDRVVERYEPYFDDGWAYLPPPTSRLRKVMTAFDPVGEPVRVEHPDGSVEVFTAGRPASQTEPAAVTPTPWERWAWDRDDNAGRTHQVESAAWSHQWDTPRSSTVDALGRAVSVTEHLSDRKLTTLTRYDIDGHVVEVVDPMGRTAARMSYDLLGRLWRTQTLDGGAARRVLDPFDRVVESRDERGALALAAYDELHRPARRWARDRAGQTCTLREVLTYGDGAGAPADAAARNLPGRLYETWDEAGHLRHDRYDLDGNATEEVRRVLSHDALLSAVAAGADWSDAAYVVDWDRPDRAALLDPVEYAVSRRFDALGRTTSVRCPVDVGGQRVEIRSRYGLSGELAEVAVDGTACLRQACYDARGQRLLAVLGNGLLCRFGYDPRTARLARLRTEPCTGDPAAGWTPSGAPVQDLGYRYDLAGNVLAILDRTPGCGVPPGPADTLDHAYGYDQLYRLVSATGRECDVPPAPPPWLVDSRCADLSRARSWTETYAYDDAGNLARQVHTGDGTTWIRTHTIAPGSNQIASVASGQDSWAYTYDAAGNATGETDSRRLSWDHADRLASFRVQAGSAEPSVFAQYRYDAAGERVCRLVRKQGGAVEATVYVAGVFERLVLVSAAGSVSRHDTVHVAAGARRLVRIRVGAMPPGEVAPPITYLLTDHLQSVAIVMDDVGSLVDREELTPFGETCFGGYARKRYRFCGKERDVESGYRYHGARYYAPWLARWLSPDPAGFVDGPNPYAYVRGNPVTKADWTGLAGADGGVPSSGTDPPPGGAVALHAGQPVEVDRVKDEVAGYVDRPRPVQVGGPAKTAPATPAATKPAAKAGADAGVRNVPPAKLGLAINEADTNKFLGTRTVNANSNPGHTIAYLRGSDGGTVVVSYGPAQRITDQNMYQFFQGNLPATVQYHVKGKDVYHVYEWPITDSQYSDALKAVNDIKADAGTYTVDHQCTSVALQVGNATGVGLPSGVGKVSGYGLPVGFTVANPYHLNEALRSQGVRSSDVTGEHFKGLLEVVK
jgi:RHS repeat-associated protein